MVSWLGRGWSWWCGARRRHPVLFGGIFWLVFWSVSAAAMIWVYSPGGLGDPERDLRSPSRRIGTPVCVADCDTETSAAADDQGAPAVDAPGTKRPVRTATPDPVPSRPVVLPTVPIPLPEVSILVDEVMTLAGNRYVQYRIDVVAKAALGEITVSANVPAEAWFSECTGQAEQRVCVDSYRGLGDAHQVSWFRRISRAQTETFVFWVHLDPTVMAGDEIVNHAHVVADAETVTSHTHVFTVPTLLGG